MPINVTSRSAALLRAGGAGSFSDFATTGLPAGVTLQAIDGETMNGLIMSRDYFARSKAGTHDQFTFCTNTATNGESWDDATMYPLALFYGLQDALTADCNAVAALNVNVSDATFGGAANDTANLARAVGSRIWIINGCTGGGPGPIEPTWQDDLCVGCMEDEVNPTARIAAINAATSNNRFWKMGFQHGELTSNEDGFTGLAMNVLTNTLWPTATGGVSRYIDIVMADVYWFATSADPDWGDHGGAIYGANGRSTSADLTTDEMARGSNYGNQVDIMRGWSPARTTIPVWIYIETADGLAGGAGVRDVTVAEFNWATWASIIHGASGISYFYRHDQFATGVAAQCTTQNALIRMLARIIKSPFALGYFTVSPFGYLYPTMAISDQMFETGIDAMCKWYSGADFSNTIGGGPTTFTSGFYIFATTRASQTVTNISAAFNIPSGSSVTVVGESRTISVTGGIAMDNFNRAGPGLGANWTTATGFSDLAIASSVRATGSTTSAHCVGYWNGSFNNDQFAQCTCIALTNGFIGLTLRHGSGVESDNAYVAFIGSDGSASIARWDNGGFTPLVTGSSSLAAGDVFRFEVSGTSLVSKKNGTTVLSTSDGTYSSGPPGLDIFQGASSGAIVDDWIGGTLTTGASFTDTFATAATVHIYKVN